MALRDLIVETLTGDFAPAGLSVLDESGQHAGHSGARPGGETHFRVEVVAAAFAGKTRIERHRMINRSLAPAFARGLHALAIRARAPDEA